MQPRNLALIGAALGVGFGAVGLIFPGSLGAFFGIQMDATSTALIRLVSAAYVGFGVLDWAALDLTDRAAWRAISVGNIAGIHNPCLADNGNTGVMDSGPGASRRLGMTRRGLA